LEGKNRQNHPNASCKKKGKEETEASVKGLAKVKARIVQAYMIFEEKGNGEDNSESYFTLNQQYTELIENRLPPE
jgi:hypothetical protein